MITRIDAMLIDVALRAVCQRVRDWMHEREIARLAKRCAAAMDAGDKTEVAYFWAALRDALATRSPTQVARMERAKGLR